MGYVAGPTNFSSDRLGGALFLGHCSALYWKAHWSTRRHTKQPYRGNSAFSQFDSTGVPGAPISKLKHPCRDYATASRDKAKRPRDSTRNCAGAL